MPHHDVLPPRTLRDAAGAMLEIRCDRCRRCGRYSRRRLIARHGADYDLRAVIIQVSADCPHRIWSKHGWPKGCEAQVGE
jgi:hypothetical protein